MAKIGIDIPVDAADDVMSMFGIGTNLGGMLPRAQSPSMAGPAPNIAGQPPASPAATPGILPQAISGAPAQPAPPPKQRPGWEHVLGMIGDVAGQALLPGVMPYIPGTTANKQWKQERSDAAQQRAADQAEQQARTRALQTETQNASQAPLQRAIQQQREAEQQSEAQASQKAQQIAQENLERERITRETQGQEEQARLKGQEAADTRDYRNKELGLEQERINIEAGKQKQDKVDQQKNKIISDEQTAFKAMQNDVTNKKLKQNSPDFAKRYVQIKGATAQKMKNLGQRPTLDQQTWGMYLLANGNDAKKAADQAAADGYAE